MHATARARIARARCSSAPRQRRRGSSRLRTNSVPIRAHPAAARRPGRRFGAGAHRGADLAVPPGTAVRAACAGRVVHAGPIAGRDRVVSMSCGGRRVSYLPLATVAVAEDAVLRAGAPVGTVARGHGGLHLGVRREGDPFGYEDPMALLPPPERPFAPAPRPQPPPAARRPAHPLPATPGPAPRPAIRSAPAGSTAPWPVWAGLAALPCGAAGSGTVVVRRRRVRERATAVRVAAHS